ncbi:MAG: hypothetical protein JWM74_6187 [Myxococcaceae bacterium]|nr:hypothetical protein [Myxococcaceae bacterium]
MPAIRKKRRDTRYEIRFPAQVRHERRTDSFFSEDVSFNGVFFRTDTPPPLRRLVTMRLVLPPGDTALHAHGMVVHVVDYENAFERVPGFGVQLYALDHTTRSIWHRFVRDVAACCPVSPYPPIDAPTRIAGPTKRTSGIRQTAVLQLAAANTNELQELCEADIRRGRVFVATELDVFEGMPVVVHVAHPDTGGSFLLDAVVHKRRLGGRGAPRGVDVDLIGMDAARQEQLFDFVRGGIVIGEPEDQTG